LGTLDLAKVRWLNLWQGSPHPPRDGEAFWKTLELPKDLSIDVRRRIGFLFQFPEHQFFAETVYDEVAFAAKNFELDSIEERVINFVAFSRLTGL